MIIAPSPTIFADLADLPPTVGLAFSPTVVDLATPTSLANLPPTGLAPTVGIWFGLGFKSGFQLGLVFGFGVM